MAAQKKDYYKQISGWIDDIYCGHTSCVEPSFISDRISWCWKFRKITPEQKDELCNRMIAFFSGDY